MDSPIPSADEPAMTAADVLRMKHRDPFAPFRVVTDDETAYPVGHPDLLLVTFDALVVGRPDPDDPRAAVGFDVVPLSRVVRLEALPPGG
jgi:hypothetical protein